MLTEAVYLKTRVENWLQAEKYHETFLKRRVNIFFSTIRCRKRRR